MRANEGPGDPLTDFHTFAFTDTTRTCTALPLPSDLVTVGFHTNAKENTKQQTSSSGLSHTGGERPQAWEQLEHCAGREQIGTQSAVSLRLLSRPHSSHSPLQTRSQPTTAAGAAQCSPPNMDNEHIWCEIVRQWDCCSQSYSSDMVIYDSKIWLQDFWHGWDLTWIWCFFSWSDSDRVGLWQWPVIVFRRPSKLIFYIFTLCGMWIKIMRETATKYNLCHPNCNDVQYEQYQQCEGLTNQHTGESELLWSKHVWGSQWFWVMFRVKAD